MSVPERGISDKTPKLMPHIAPNRSFLLIFMFQMIFQGRSARMISMIPEYAIQDIVD
jgi:hypothetical protein